jgi:integrase
MSKQRGVAIYDRWSDEASPTRPAKRWYVRVWDATSRRYLGQSFEDRAVGVSWGEEKRAQFVLRLDNAAPASLTALSAQYVRELRERGRNSGYVDEIERVCQAVALAGADDLKGADVAGVVRGWLSRVAGNWYPDAADNKFRRRTCLVLSPITKNRFLQHLRSLMRYGVMVGALTKDPLAGIRRFTEDKPLKPIFTLDELRALLHPSREGDAYFLIFAVLIYTGCRMGEALHLRWENLDITGKRLSVKLSDAYALKRGKERTVFLQPELSAILEPLKQQTGYVIAGEIWRKRNRKHLGVSFKAYLKRCGVAPGDRSPHSARHTWVSLLLASGENVFFVAGEAGHEALITTQGYARGQGAYRDGVIDWKRGVFQLREKKKMEVEPVGNGAWLAD